MSNTVTVTVELEITRRGAEIAADEISRCMKILDRDSALFSRDDTPGGGVATNRPARTYVILRKFEAALSKSVKKALEAEEPDEPPAKGSVREERYGRPE